MLSSVAKSSPGPTYGTTRLAAGDGGDDAQLSADKEELDRAMEAPKSAIQAKGRQIQQLEAYLAVL